MLDQNGGVSGGPGCLGLVGEKVQGNLMGERETRKSEKSEKENKREMQENGGDGRSINRSVDSKASKCRKEQAGLIRVGQPRCCPAGPRGFCAFFILRSSLSILSILSFSLSTPSLSLHSLHSVHTLYTLYSDLTRSNPWAPPFGRDRRPQAPRIIHHPRESTSMAAGGPLA